MESNHQARTNDDTTTWRQEISRVMALNGDGWEDMEHCTISDEELDRQFEAKAWAIKGAPFTAWTRDFVYFPVCYDGEEWCGSAPRNPCDISLEHQGA